jgi:hypothetical protein
MDWIEFGAGTSKGIKTMIKFFFLFVINFQAHAAFDNLSIRYLMPADFYTKLLVLFPDADRKQLQEIKDNTGRFPYFFDLYCVRQEYDDKKRLQVFGTISPTTGEPQSFEPELAMVNTLVVCGKSIINNEFNLLANPKIGKKEFDILNRFFPVFKDDWEVDAPHFFDKQFLSVIDLKNPMIKAHTLHLIHYMLGPDTVIEEYGYARNADEIATGFMEEYLAEKKYETLSEYTVWVLTNLIIRDEFLSF